MVKDWQNREEEMTKHHKTYHPYLLCKHNSCEKVMEVSCMQE